MPVVRYGFYEGAIHHGSEAEFERLAQSELLPVLKRFPGATNASIMRAVEIEKEAPSFTFGIRIVYEDLAACHAALQSSARADARAVVARMMHMFKGKVHHYIVEETT